MTSATRRSRIEPAARFHRNRPDEVDGYPGFHLIARGHAARDVIIDVAMEHPDLLGTAASCSLKGTMSPSGHELPRATFRDTSAHPPISDGTLHYPTDETCQKGISQHLGHSHDYLCLNFGSNLAAAIVCLQSRMRRSRLQLPVFPRLWPRFRCEEEFPEPLFFGFGPQPLRSMVLL